MKSASRPAQQPSLPLLELGSPGTAAGSVWEDLGDGVVLDRVVVSTSCGQEPARAWEPLILLTPASFIPWPRGGPAATVTAFSCLLMFYLAVPIFVLFTLR